MANSAAPVGPASGGSGRQRYLIGSGDAALLGRVVADLRQDSKVRVDRVLETSAGVGGAVIETTPDHVRHLRGKHGPGLVIEPDQELGLS